MRLWRRSNKCKASELSRIGERILGKCHGEVSDGNACSKLR